MHRTGDSFSTTGGVRARLVAAAALGLGILALGVLPLGPVGDAQAAEAADTLVADAGRNLRLRNLGKAVKLAQQALAIAPDNPDAHIVYQDAAREVLSLEELVATYRRKATEEKPDDPLYSFLHLRLLPPTDGVKGFAKAKLKFKDSPWPRAGQARAVEMLGKFREAVTLYEEAVALAGPRQIRFRAYLAYGLERASRWDSAVGVWQQVVDKAPADVAAKLGLGDCMRRSGDTAGALKVLNEAARAAPTDGEPPYRIALVHLDTGRYDDAVKSAGIALTREKGMVVALCVSAEAELKKALKATRADLRTVEDKDVAAASKFANRAVASDPEAPEAHFVLGAVQEALGEGDADALDAALESYDEALDLIAFPGPEKVRVLNAKAFVQLRLAKWEDALVTVDKALAMDDQSVAAYAHGGHALAALGGPQDKDKSKKAISRYFKPGLKIDKKNARLNHGIGTTFWDMKKHNDATKHLKVAVKAEPGNGLYRLSLGEIHYEMRRYKDAVKELFEATELRPKDPVTWSVYARACTAAKYYKEAAEAYEIVLTLDKEAVEEHLFAAILYDRLGNEEKATEQVEKFVDKGGWDQNLDVWLKKMLGEED